MRNVLIYILVITDLMCWWPCSPSQPPTIPYLSSFYSSPLPSPMFFLSLSSRSAVVPPALCAVHAARLSFKERPAHWLENQTMVGVFFDRYWWFRVSAMLIFWNVLEWRQRTPCDIQQSCKANRISIIWFGIKFLTSCSGLSMDFTVRTNGMLASLSLSNKVTII